MTGYNVKLVESSGIPLARQIQKNFSPAKCHWEECAACEGNDEKMGSRCRLSNVVYEGVCLDCLDDCDRGKRSERDIGRYIGESGRTLAERSGEHARGARAMDADNFIVKHWVLQHPVLDRKPKIKFKVLKTYKDPLSRMIAESVLIDKVSNLNSKSEWRNNKMCRLVVETKFLEKEKEKCRLREEEENSQMLKKIEDLKNRMSSAEDTNTEKVCQRTCQQNCQRTCQTTKKVNKTPVAKLVKMTKRNNRDPGDTSEEDTEPGSKKKRRITGNVGPEDRDENILRRQKGRVRDTLSSKRKKVVKINPVDCKSKTFLSSWLTRGRKKEALGEDGRPPEREIDNTDTEPAELNNFHCNFVVEKRIDIMKDHVKTDCPN